MNDNKIYSLENYKILQDMKYYNEKEYIDNLSQLMIKAHSDGDDIKALLIMKLVTETESYKRAISRMKHSGKIQ